MLQKGDLPGWFEEPGAYVLVDGQFGSTGKGLLAGVLAEYGQDSINWITTNAGPNSGHTAYYQDPVLFELPPEKIVTQQLPVASVFLEKMGRQPMTLINAGAVIDDEILHREMVRNEMDHRRVFIHPNAVVIEEEDRVVDKITSQRIAGTGKGIGPALARKVMRHGGNMASEVYRPMLPHGDRTWDHFWDWAGDRVFVETAQGYSLGINSSRFYPNVTSRECTVMQALADARIPAQMLRKVVACYRTFPIRVGNTENTSGDCYEDQRETTWEELGLEPELTTVTKRVRRVFTWSRVQFRESVAVNRPDVIFLNFCNYLDPGKLRELIGALNVDYFSVMGHLPLLLAGHGPHSGDVGRFM